MYYFAIFFFFSFFERNDDELENFDTKLNLTAATFGCIRLILAKHLKQMVDLSVKLNFTNSPNFGQIYMLNTDWVASLFLLK